MSENGNGNEYGGAGRNAYEQLDQQRYDPFDNPLPRNATSPTSSFPHALPQGGLPGFAVPQPTNMFMGAFLQQPPNQYGFNPSQQMGGHQYHFSQGTPPQYGPHGNLPPSPSIPMAMNPSWPSIQGNMYAQQPPYPGMQNSLQAFAGPLPPPQVALHQHPLMQSDVSHQPHTFGNSAFNMQQAVFAPPFASNPPILPDPATAFDDDYIHPRTGRPTRAFLPHEKVLLRQYYRLKHPLAPNATDRHIQMWHTGLCSKELTEWDKFVADNESKSQADDRAEAIEDHLEWIKDIKQSTRDEIRSDARGNEYGRPGRKPGSRNKPKTNAPAKDAGVEKGNSRKGGSVLLRKKSTMQLDSDDEEEDDDADESDTIVVEVPKKGKNKGNARVTTQKKSASACKTKNTSKHVADEASEEDTDEEKAVEENYEDMLGQEDLEDMDGSGTDMEFTEDDY